MTPVDVLAQRLHYKPVMKFLCSTHCTLTNDKWGNTVWANCCKGNTCLMAILACSPLMRWIKRLFASQRKKPIWMKCPCIWFHWASQVCAALSKTCSSHIFCFSFCLILSQNTHHISLASSFSISAVSIGEIWISDELILRWIIVMVYSVRVLLCCWCVCWIVCSDLSWRLGEFDSSTTYMHTHANTHLRARTHTPNPKRCS